MADLNTRVRNLLATGIKNKASVVQIWRRSDGTTGEYDLVHTSPMDKADGFADRLVEKINDELDEVCGPQQFLLKVRHDGEDVAVEKVKGDGRWRPADGTIVVGRTPSGSVDPRRAPPGALPALDVGELQLPDGALTGGATTAVAMTLLKQQMRHTESMTRIVVELSGKIHEPLIKQTEILGNALEKATQQLTASAAAHVDQIRSTRVLEAEARTEERKAEAWAKTGEQLAKYLPGVLARFSRKFGIVAADEETDPLLERLVMSFKPEQLGRMQEILGPEQIALFAEVWAVMDERKKKRGEKGKATVRDMKKSAPASTSSSSAPPVLTNGNGASSST